MNESGIQPLEYKIIVQADKVEEASEGGIVIPDEVVNKKQLAQVYGTLVDKGALAFAEWEDEPPIGARVYFARYAGVQFERKGQTYTLMNDKDVMAMEVAS